MDSAKIHLVVLAPSAADVESLSKLLAAASWQVHHATTLVEARELMRATEARVLVVETSFPGGSWIDALELLTKEDRQAVLVVSATHADDRLWAEAINYGAYDLIPKPYYGPEILRILRSAHIYAANQVRRPLVAAG
jgi:DNA-binding NtrC family response regulator